MYAPASQHGRDRFVDGRIVGCHDVAHTRAEGGRVHFANNEAELDAALDAAETGDVIRIGGKSGTRVETGSIRDSGYDEHFTKDLTITTKGLHFRGQLGSGSGSRINAEWTFTEQFRLEGVYLREKYKSGPSRWHFEDRGQISNCWASQSHLHLDSHQVLVTGLYNADGLTIDPSACLVTGCLLTRNVTDNGTRTVLEGWGTNRGNPAAGEGQWADESSSTFSAGATVLDTVSGDLYVPFPATAPQDWLRIEGEIDPHD